MAPRPSARALATLVAALLAAGTPFPLPTAQAADTPRVLVAPFQVIHGDLRASLGRRAARVMADEVRVEDGLTLVTPPRPKPKVANPAGLKAARKEIATGEWLLRRLRVRAAAGALDKGIDAYESFPAQLDVPTLREAYLKLAVARSRMGHNRAAGDALESAVRLAPSFRVSGRYPPMFRRLIDHAKRRVLGAGSGSLSVSGAGQVSLDGRKLGPAPASAQGLPAGNHFLQVRRNDGSAWGKVVSIVSGPNQVAIPPPPGLLQRGSSVAADDPGLADIEQNHLDDAVLAAAGRLAKKYGADFVILGGIYKNGDDVGCATHLYSAADQSVVALRPVEFDPDLVSAGIELNKVADQVSRLTGDFPEGEVLPGPVAKALVKPAVAIVRPRPRPRPRRHHVVRAPKKKTLVVVQQRPRKQPDLGIVEPPHHQAAADLGEDDGTGGIVAKPAPSHSRTWIWIAAGAAAVVAAGTAGFILYKNATTPITGTATLTFQ